MEPDKISSSADAQSTLSIAFANSLKLELLCEVKTLKGAKIEWKIYMKKKRERKRCLRFTFPFCSFHIQFCVHPVRCCSCSPTLPPFIPLHAKKFYNEKTELQFNFIYMRIAHLKLSCLRSFASWFCQSGCCEWVDELPAFACESQHLTQRMSAKISKVNRNAGISLALGIVCIQSYYLLKDEDSDSLNYSPTNQVTQKIKFEMR